MTGLLDTHTFYWLDHDPSRLSPTVTQFVLDPANEIVLSVVSVWEIIIKNMIGKFGLPEPIENLVARQVANGVRILPVTLDHVYAVQNLPLHHHDPFDRLLAAQTIVEGAALLTKDAVFAQYPVTVVW